ncbi:ExbD/TolR family protein [Psychroserpens sp. XS_ASV72]|uniref:ExbD/TolR family protein n=1 Tax=Psychroserpens sp. XS_ASV72 TaxID=3241293 RepID=UPI00351902CF
MVRSRQTSPQVNAGSMADIAFLLLIFFLVTAMIPNDKGIKHTLPEPCPKNENCDTPIHERNILAISINSNNELFLEKELIKVELLTKITKDFLDNNGDGSCVYCQGNQSASSSDNPTTAIISLKSDPNASYEFYIKIQDALTKAYYDLRSRYAMELLNKDVNKLTNSELKQVREAYPFILSEVD